MRERVTIRRFTDGQIAVVSCPDHRIVLSQPLHLCGEFVPVNNFTSPAEYEQKGN
jgi:hypothetical protein